MATNVVMPKMGYDMTEGTILRWIKNEGDAITKGEPIAEIQTEKVNIEIEAFDTGTLAQILHKAGEVVPVGDTIAVIALPGESYQPASAPAQKAPAEPAPAVQAPAQQAAEYPSGPAAGYPSPGARIKASPLARKMAAARGLDLATIRGSGPNGRIVRRDVEAAQAAAPVPALPRVPAVVPSPAGAGARTISLTRMRQAIARRLSESKINAPHFYVTIAIDMTEAMAFRTQLNAAVSEEEKVSFNDLILRAVAMACLKVPAVNASWSESAILEHGTVNLGIAVAMPEGLVVPVLQQADSKRLTEMARETKELIARAKSNRLRPDEMSGGTITVSNLGAFDVESFTAIINPPESAILAVGSIKKEPVVDAADQLQVRSIMRVTMSSDHRVIDGATAAKYLAEVKRLLQSPMLLLL